MKCRIDKKPCKVFLNFGKMPIANGFLRKNKKNKEYFYNLKVAFNERLSLFQLAKNPSPQKMFNKNYPFYTSSSKNMVKHFKDTAAWIKKNYLKKNSNVLEIGSNDGTFLKNFKRKSSVGFEPSRSVHLIAKKNNINSFNFFFNQKNLKLLKIKNKNFDLVYGANVFCHIPNQIELIKTIDKVLSKNGTIIFEEPYLGSMFKKTSYDQIYDEHIYMFSLTSIEKIYRLFGFTLVDAVPLKTHGGSMRYVLKRGKISKQSKRLKLLFNLEKKNKVNNFKGCAIFKKKVELSKKKLLNKINKILSKKERICGYGATSKSTTILNYCNINNKMIDCIFDTTKDKIGKLSPGSHIPIEDYKKFKNSDYRYVFLFAWNHKKEIFKKEKNKNIKWFTHLN